MRLPGTQVSRRLLRPAGIKSTSLPRTRKRTARPPSQRTHLCRSPSLLTSKSRSLKKSMKHSPLTRSNKSQAVSKRITINCIGQSRILRMLRRETKSSRRMNCKITSLAVALPSLTTTLLQRTAISVKISVARTKEPRGSGGLHRFPPHRVHRSSGWAASFSEVGSRRTLRDHTI